MDSDDDVEGGIRAAMTDKERETTTPLKKRLIVAKTVAAHRPRSKFGGLLVLFGEGPPGCDTSDDRAQHALIRAARKIQTTGRLHMLRSLTRASLPLRPARIFGRWRSNRVVGIAPCWVPPRLRRWHLRPLCLVYAGVGQLRATYLLGLYYLIAQRRDRKSTRLNSSH